MDVAVQSEGLGGTSPLLGLSPLCLLSCFSGKGLPAEQGMACPSISTQYVREPGPVVSLRSSSGGFGASLSWLCFLSSSCWRKCWREEGRMSFVLGLEVLRAGNGQQEPGGWRALPCGQVFRRVEEGEAKSSGGECRKHKPILNPSQCVPSPRLYHISMVV